METSGCCPILTCVPKRNTIAEISLSLTREAGRDAMKLLLPSNVHFLSYQHSLLGDTTCPH